MPQNKSTTTYRKAMSPKTGKNEIVAFKGAGAAKKGRKSSRIKLMPLRKAAKGAAEEGKQEAAGTFANRNEDKAKKMTRLMRKGYRKGYRVKSTRGGRR